MATGRSATYDEQVIAAAREVFSQQGFAAPMSEVAQRAGVGVASVYRRYPSKQQLAEQVRIAAVRRIITEAETALAEESDPWQAFTRFLFGCLREGTGIGTVLPPNDEFHTFSDEFRRLQERMSEIVDALVSAAQRSGDLRPDFGWADVSLLFKHLSPAVATSERRRAELRARYLSLVIEGLRAGGSPLPGPAPEGVEISAMCETPKVEQQDRTSHPDGG